jgi:deoxyribodipyrimidine photo-lyase
MKKLFFPTDISAIYARLDNIDPLNYCKNRNFIDGDVTLLSPYISRGFLSTNLVLQHLIEQGYDLTKIEKFIQELAWRDYWQHTWKEMGDLVNFDIKNQQTNVSNFSISRAFIDSNTGIKAIDDALDAFYQTGYLHNHIRMYLASMACNVAQSYWLLPAKWMYYHLLDADWASNVLSWQWVAGSNSHKKYFANQENINKYCGSDQFDSYLNVDYDELPLIDIPDQLSDLTSIDLKSILPETNLIQIDQNEPTLIYNFYNLDPHWHEDTNANRILLLDPSVFEKYPVSDKSIEFMMNLAKNIPHIKVFRGSFLDLENTHQLNNVIYKEHPLNKNYKGKKEQRDWMFNISGSYSSYFKYWKECKKQLEIGY